jgi:hypothetical protein
MGELRASRQWPPDLEIVVHHGGTEDTEENGSTETSVISARLW